jgi:hypothetical protein
MKNRMNRTARKIAAFFVLCGSVLGGAVVVDTAPAHAALPGLFCSNVTSAMAGKFGDAQNPIYMCVSNENLQQQAGIGAPDGSRLYAKHGAELQLELAYFSFDQWPNGVAHVYAAPTRFRQLIGYQVIQTDPRPLWVPGVFCARLVNTGTGEWEDLACVDTDEVPRRG